MERTEYGPLAQGAEQPLLCARPADTQGDSDIRFPECSFCFTGASSKYKRVEFEQVVRELGGERHASVTDKLNYMVIGAEGNPCWAFACYGRKVEKAVQLRRKGVRLVIVHENDFHDAVLDAR